MPAPGIFYPLWFAYVVFAVAIGDRWERAGAATYAVVAAGLLLRGHQGYYPLYYPAAANLSGWLIFVFSCAALVALVHRHRRADAVRDTAAPVVASSLDDPVLIIRGHAQILQQGTGVVFDTRGRQGQHVTHELANVRGAGRGGVE